MKLKMAENSIFAILLRSPWWVSLLAGVGIVVAARLFLPIEFAVFSGSPFLVIAAVVAWRQLRAPSGKSVDAALERVRTMSWEAFAAALEEGFKREGYAVKRVIGTGAGAADFELEKNGRLSLAAAKRWKASRTGAEPLRDLCAAGNAPQFADTAGECLYLCAGDITDTARAYATENKIRLIEGLELVKLAGTLA